MASEDHDIQLFSKKIKKKLSNYKEPFLLQLYLLSFTTWLDHSLLKDLVKVWKNEEAIKLLDKFESDIDSSLPVTLHPVPAPSQLIIPLDDSDFTVIATIHSKNLEETTLKQVNDIKKLLQDRWKITEHSIQLVALQAKFGYLYWLIPKTVAPLVTNCEVVEEEGIIISCLFPDTFFSDDHNSVVHKLAVGPFNFLITASKEV